MPSAQVQNIVNSLATQLLADATLDALIGNSIYHLIAPQNTDLPLLIFSVSDSEIIEHFSTVRVNIAIDFDIYDDLDTGTAAGVGVIEDALFNAVEHLSLTATGWEKAVLRFQTRGLRVVEEEAIRVSSRAIIEGFTTQF